MFGAYRYGLALAVVMSHLLGLSALGWIAVYSFFILSGYLMTTIMHSVYGYSKRGKVSFIINRGLRLLPLNIIIFIISVIIVMSFGAENSQKFHPKMTHPTSLFDVITNITMIYPSLFPYQFSVQTLPPSWTLTVEIFFYCLIALGISYNKRLNLFWCLLAIIYITMTFILGLDVQWRYSMLWAGALPFSVGALLFHYKKTLLNLLPGLKSSTTLTWCLIAFFMNALFCTVSTDSIDGLLFNLTFYFNIPISACLIMNLMAKTPHRFAGLDRILGELSYPIYLLHMPIAFGISMIVLGRADRIYDEHSALLLGLTILTCTIISLPLIYAIDRPIQKLRSKIKSSCTV